MLNEFVCHPCAGLFTNRQKEKDTELSKYIWNLKDKNITNYSIKWSIVKQKSGYNSITNSWNLCLSKKLVNLETKTI